MHHRFELLVILGASLSSMIGSSVVAEESWKIYRLEISEQVFKIPYSITNANVIAMEAEPHFTSMIITISNEPGKDGIIEIVMPRNLVDATFNNGYGIDDEFIVLLDGEEASYEEIDNSRCFRTLSINFDRGTEEIEIIGTSLSGRPTEVPPVYFSEKFEDGSGAVYVAGCTNLGLDDKGIVLEALDFEGRVHQTESVTPNADGTFSSSLMLEGELVASGNYTVQARYAGYTYVPEFPVSLIILGISFVGLLVGARLFLSANKHNVY